MNFKPLSISEVILIKPVIFADNRGFFMESFQAPRFWENGIKAEFVQDNHSRSRRGVLRGLHYQKAPAAQAKLVRVVRGAIFDVAVDIRPNSPSYGKWVGEILDEVNHRMLYIPAGFAHGFLTLTEDTDVLYKATHVYSPEHDAGILWNDPAVGIEWPVIGMDYIISEKDQKHPRL